MSPPASLEAKLGAYKRRPHVIVGYDDEQRQAHRAALIRRERADPRDVFVVTGVMRGRSGLISEQLVAQLMLGCGDWSPPVYLVGSSSCGPTTAIQRNGSARPPSWLRPDRRTMKMCFCYLDGCRASSHGFSRSELNVAGPRSYSVWQPFQPSRPEGMPGDPF